MIDSVDEGVMDFPAKPVVVEGSELTLDVAASVSSRNTHNCNGPTIGGTWAKGAIVSLDVQPEYGQKELQEELD